MATSRTSKRSSDISDMKALITVAALAATIGGAVVLAVGDAPAASAAATLPRRGDQVPQQQAPATTNQTPNTQANNPFPFFGNSGTQQQNPQAGTLPSQSFRPFTRTRSSR